MFLSHYIFFGVIFSLGFTSLLVKSREMVLSKKYLILDEFLTVEKNKSISIMILSWESSWKVIILTLNQNSWGDFY